MLREDATHLEGLPGEAVDIDVGERSAWVAVCSKEGGFLAGSSNQFFKVPDDVRFPLVRWMDRDRLLLVDTRTAGGRENAFVFTLAGEEIRRFCAGDGVKDVLVAGDRIVVTYFDEGVFGNVAPSAEGLAVFSADGRVAFGYHSGVKNAVAIADCYCACLSKPDEVCFFPYTGFPLVRLNLKALEQEVHETPSVLAGSSALAADGDSFCFYSPYAENGVVFRWRPGGQAVPVARHPGPLRGYGRGSFLSIGSSGYAVVSV